MSTVFGSDIEDFREKFAVAPFEQPERRVFEARTGRTARIEYRHAVPFARIGDVRVPGQRERTTAAFGGARQGGIPVGRGVQVPVRQKEPHAAHLFDRKSRIPAENVAVTRHRRNGHTAGEALDDRIAPVA